MARLSKNILSYLLCFCLLTVCLAQGIMYVHADTTGTVFGIDAGSYLSVRDGPSLSNKLLDRLYNDNEVTILDTIVGSDRTWYKITYEKDGQPIVGFSSAEYIRINVTYETDEEFEAYLTAQGFPEDYKVLLRDVHAYHPQWVFQAEHLSVTWGEALAAQCNVGRNTIQNPDAWKSMEYGAYDWKKGDYVTFDSGGWVTASPALVAYCLDPRNFLTPDYILQFEDLHYSPNQTEEGVKAILPDVLDIHAADLIKASRETQVNAYFLATRIAQEGTHKNGLGTGTVPGYEGYYNFLDIGAYAHNGNSAVTNGAIYAKNKGWDTPYKCLVGSAQWVGEKYINVGQDTLYYQKFNVVNTQGGLYNHQYMTNVMAAASEGNIRYKRATQEEKDSLLTMVIPVYKEMPAALHPQPSQEGDNNNFLDSLSVEGYALTPVFDRYRMQYSLHVGQATSIKAAAQTNSQEATLTGTGDISLHKGDNTVAVTVTATSGEVRTYTITVTTEGGEPPDNNSSTPDSSDPGSGDTSSDSSTPPPPPPAEPTITGQIYTVTDTITKVEPSTTVTDFITHLAVADGTAAVYTADGQPKPEGFVGTGDILRLYSGEVLHKSYPVLIIGDVNGDGKITPVDALRVQKYLIGLATIDGYYLQAADANRNGKAEAVDVLRCQKYILGMLPSLQ